MHFAWTNSEKFRGGIASFVKDESGAVLPVATVTIAALIGLTTLAIDLARYADLQTQLQKAADAFALAAAAELDGDPGAGGTADAISRANAAIDTLMASRNTSEAGVAVTVSSRTFLASLPADDATNPATDITTDPTKARFVEVVVNPVTVNTFFPATLFGAATNTLSTTAVAVAGFTQALCKTSPMFICNPYEGQKPGVYDPAHIGKMFRLKTGPGDGSPYAPGNYGFLSVDGNGAKVLKDALAASDSAACFAQDGVTTEPGNIASASDVLNVRFDIYRGSAKGYKDADHPPAPNVRKGCLPAKGVAADTCGVDYDKDEYCQAYDPIPIPPIPGAGPPTALPLDAGWENQAYGVGDGNWSLGLMNYWLWNHNGELLPAFPQNYANPTRYDVYQYEIDNNRLGDYSAPALLPPLAPPDTSLGIYDLLPSKNIKGEIGKPMCNQAGTGDNQRRVIYIAVVDCTALDLKGGKNYDVRVTAFAKVFLIRPIRHGDETIYGEFLGLVKPGADDGVLHDIVQLYR